MNNDLRIQIIRRILGHFGPRTIDLGAEGTTRVEDYTSETHLRQELSTIFRRFPVIVAHASALRDKGAFVTAQVGHVPILAIRDREGVLRAFVNACRHRGARLTREAKGRAKAFVCPYHGWTYQDHGELKVVPQKEAFPSLDMGKCGLVTRPVAERGGFIWVVPGGERVDIDAWLGEITADFDAFDLQGHVVYKSAIQRPRANWKLIMDAFSEGYHLKTLHRKSIRPFFHDHGAIFDRLGPHARSFGARKGILAAEDTPESEWDFRAWTTPLYNLFPNAIFVFHPDWVSLITLFPDGTDSAIAHHQMLHPADNDKPDAYWDRTFSLINDQVFAAEDLAICQEIQATARSGADQSWRLGGMEAPVAWFHQNCTRAIAGASAADLIDSDGH